MCTVKLEYTSCAYFLPPSLLLLLLCIFKNQQRIGIAMSQYSMNTLILSKFRLSNEAFQNSTLKQSIHHESYYQSCHGKTSGIAQSGSHKHKVHFTSHILTIQPPIPTIYSSFLHTRITLSTLWTHPINRWRCWSRCLIDYRVFLAPARTYIHLVHDGVALAVAAALAAVAWKCCNITPTLGEPPIHPVVITLYCFPTFVSDLFYAFFCQFSSFPDNDIVAVKVCMVVCVYVCICLYVHLHLLHYCTGLKGDILSSK